MPDAITPGEESDLLGRLEELEFREVRIRGQTARRTARHFGIDYGYESREITEGEPPPDWLEPVRDRAGELGGIAPQELAEILVQRYPPGSTIGWHRDAPMFGSVVGVSLGSGCRFRFRRPQEPRKPLEVELEPRSLYVLRGAARWSWQHSIPPTKALRYSITFRTLRPAGRSPGEQRS